MRFDFEAVLSTFQIIAHLDPSTFVRKTRVVNMAIKGLVGSSPACLGVVVWRAISTSIEFGESSMVIRGTSPLLVG